MCHFFQLCPVALALAAVLGGGVGYAQSPEEIKLKLSKRVFLNLVDEEPYFLHYELFENINKVAYYEDKALRKEIAALEAEDPPNFPELNYKLTKFVRQFGIENFRQDRDLDYVWKLGQVREVLQDTVAALFYYSIALKNNSRNATQIQLWYDALRADRQVEYVDLDYYYKIVGARLKIDTLAPPKGVLLKMSRNVNSDYPDYAPYMHPKGGVLIFTSKRDNFNPMLDWKFLQVEDLFYTEKNLITGGWDEAKPFPSTINSPYNEGSACLNQDGTLLVFTRCNAPDGLGVCDIYQAEFVFGDWKNVENLGPKVNSPDWDSQPSLSSDGQRLYFTSNRDGGFGRTDLYVSERQRNGKWGEAQNLGPVINTIEDEVTPFIHPLNNTLYFSSTGHIMNFGGFDIFRSRRDQTHWEEPLNLGPLVNSKGDEYYFSISGDGDSLYYAAAKPRKPKDFDLYSFAMPMGARPDANTTLSGYLVDSLTGRPLTGIVVAIDLDRNVEIEPIYINPTGYFEFRLVNGRNYQLLVLGENAIRVNDEDLLDVDSLFSTFIRSIDEEKPVIFDALEFERNSTKLKTAVNTRIQGLIQFLTEHPYAKLLIKGHTDSDGESAYNRQLSQARANALKEYIVAHSNVPPQAITAIGYGDSRPVFPNDSPEHKARNRRVEFEIVIPQEFRKRYYASLGLDDAEIAQLTVEGEEDEEEDEISAENDPFNFLLDEGLESGGEFDLDVLPWLEDADEFSVEDIETLALLEEDMGVEDVPGEDAKVLTIQNNRIRQRPTAAGGLLPLPGQYDPLRAYRPSAPPALENDLNDDMGLEDFGLEDDLDDFDAENLEDFSEFGEDDLPSGEAESGVLDFDTADSLATNTPTEDTEAEVLVETPEEDFDDEDFVLETGLDEDWDLDELEAELGLEDEWELGEDDLNDDFDLFYLDADDPLDFSEDPDLEDATPVEAPEDLTNPEDEEDDGMGL